MSAERDVDFIQIVQNFAEEVNARSGELASLTLYAAAFLDLLCPLRFLSHEVWGGILGEIKLQISSFVEKAVKQSCAIQIEQRQIVPFLAKGALVDDTIVSFTSKELGYCLRCSVFSRVIASGCGLSKRSIDC